MTAMRTEATQIISTGSSEIDKKPGGGIPTGSLVLLEGQSDAGKSVLSQHFTHGALNAKMSVAYYSTENTVKSLMSQMSSLNLDVTDYFLCDRMRVYPLETSSLEDEHARDGEDRFDRPAQRRLLAHVDSPIAHLTTPTGRPLGRRDQGFVGLRLRHAG